MKTCVFCDEWGSAADHRVQEKPLQDQIAIVQETLAKKFGARKFLVYFQAYTNTFLKFDLLQEQWNQALKTPGVVGIVVGTRPDCLSKSLLRFWDELSQNTFVAIELGLQSFVDETLKFYERGHSVDDSLRALEKIAELQKVNLGIHLMFGAPLDTEKTVIEAAEMCNKLPIQNVKLHNLHVLRNTPLATLYEKGLFKPVDLVTYTAWVGEFLKRLSPNIAVHRLAGYAPRWNELVAPEWTSNKMRVYQHMMDAFSADQIEQGSAFKASNTASETTLN